MNLPDKIKRHFINQAKELLKDLESQSLKVVLVPAPDKHFPGHKIRSVVNENPDWYRGLFADIRISRRCVIKALKRIVDWEMRPLSVYVGLLYGLIKLRLTNGYNSECYQCYFEPVKEVKGYFDGY